MTKPFVSALLVTRNEKSYIEKSLRSLIDQDYPKDCYEIIVIDGKEAFVGGFNIGREYLGMDQRFGYWRDTHLKLCGACVVSLHIRFILDWNYATKQNLFLENRLIRGSV